MTLENKPPIDSGNQKISKLDMLQKIYRISLHHFYSTNKSSAFLSGIILYVGYLGVEFSGEALKRRKNKKD